MNWFKQQSLTDSIYWWGRRGRVVDGFTTRYAISVGQKPTRSCFVLLIF